MLVDSAARYFSISLGPVSVHNLLNPSTAGLTFCQGTVAIFDHDTVSISNLHRQILHATDRVGMNKAESACISLTASVYHLLPLLKLMSPVSIRTSVSLIMTKP